MKNERGSALLIVMLIVFVTGTIGAAVSSFVLYNYRLRLFDNAIGRAEYEAEKLIDTAYVATQNVVEKYMIDCANDARDSVSANAENFDQNAIFSELEVEFENGLTNKYDFDLNDSDTFGSRFTVATEATLGWLPGNDQPDPTLDKQLIATEAVDNKNADGKLEKLTISLSAYSKIEGESTLVHIMADFVIQFPKYSDVNLRNYDLNQIVGITNWQMNDWGYL